MGKQVYPQRTVHTRLRYADDVITVMVARELRVWHFRIGWHKEVVDQGTHERICDLEEYCGKNDGRNMRGESWEVQASWAKEILCVHTGIFDCIESFRHDIFVCSSLIF